MKVAINFHINPEDVVEGIYEPKFPTRSNEGDAGFDFYAPRDIYLKPWECTVVDLGVIVSANCENASLNNWTMMVPRSSSGYKKGITLLNTLGVIDKGYCGPKDRLMAVIGRRSFSPSRGPMIMESEERMLAKIAGEDEYMDEPIIKRGERFLQLIFIPGTNIVAHNSHDLPTHGESRGGFGSTGE